MDAEPVLNRPRQVWVASGVAMLGTRWTLTGICCRPAQAGAEGSMLVRAVCSMWAVGSGAGRTEAVSVEYGTPLECEKPTGTGFPYWMER